MQSSGFERPAQKITPFYFLGSHGSNASAFLGRPHNQAFLLQGHESIRTGPRLMPRVSAIWLSLMGSPG